MIRPTAFPPPLPAAAVDAAAVELYRIALSLLPPGHPETPPGRWDHDLDGSGLNSITTDWVDDPAPAPNTDGGTPEQ